MYLQSLIRLQVLRIAQVLLCVFVAGLVGGCAVYSSQTIETATENTVSSCVQNPVVAVVSRERDITFYPDGGIQIREGYPNSSGRFVAHGCSIWMRSDAASIRATGSFLDGVQHGTFLVYFRSGRLEMISHFENGRQNGATTAYYENGHIRCVQGFQDGIAHGWFGRWYENQMLGEEGTFVAGKKHGRWLYYWSNGTLAMQEEYVSGELLRRTSWDR